LIGKEQGSSFTAQCEKILNFAKNESNSWPFREPIKQSEVPDYYDIIKEPMGIIMTRFTDDREETDREEIRRQEAVHR
jgi:Bromodomain